MRHFERRAANAFPYFKLAEWDATALTYRDGKRAFDSESAAQSSASKPGRYRLSRVTNAGRTDLAPFEVS